MAVVPLGTIIWFLPPLLLQKGGLKRLILFTLMRYGKSALCSSASALCPVSSVLAAAVLTVAVEFGLLDGSYSSATAAPGAAMARHAICFGRCNSGRVGPVVQVCPRLPFCLLQTAPVIDIRATSPAWVQRRPYVRRSKPMGGAGGGAHANPFSACVWLRQTHLWGCRSYLGLASG